MGGCPCKLWGPPQQGLKNTLQSLNPPDSPLPSPSHSQSEETGVEELQEFSRVTLILPWENISSYLLIH